MENVGTWLLSSPPAAWLQAFGTPIIGVVAVYVALQSARTARNKLKFDMFEKRVETYRELSTMLADARRTGFFSHPLMDNFHQLQAQARFMFSDEAIDTFLSAAETHLRELVAGPNEGDNLEHLRTRRLLAVKKWRFAYQRKESVREALAINPWLHSVIWLSDHTNQWDDLTLPYLRLSH